MSHALLGNAASSSSSLDALLGRKIEEEVASLEGRLLTEIRRIGRAEDRESLGWQTEARRLEERLRAVEGRQCADGASHVASLSGIEVRLSGSLDSERDLRRHEYGQLRETMQELVDAMRDGMSRFQFDLESMGATFRQEVDQVSGRAQRSGLEFRDLEVKLREEMSALAREHRATTMSFREQHTVQRTALEALEVRANEDITRLAGRHDESRLRQQASLDDLEKRLRHELPSGHQTALEELEVRLRRERASSPSPHVHLSALNDMEARLRLELERGQMLVLGELEAKLADFASRLMSGSSSRGLEDFEVRHADLEAEVARLRSAAPRHDGFADVLVELREEHRLALVHFEARHADLGAEVARLRSAAPREEYRESALRGELSVEIVETRLMAAMKHEVARASGEHQRAHEMLRELLMSLKDGHGTHGRKHVEFQAALESLELRMTNKLGSRGATTEMSMDVRNQLGRIAQLEELIESHRAAQFSSLEELMAGHSRLDVELRAEVKHLDSRVMAELGKLAHMERVIKSGHGQQELSVAGIALEDAEGRRWHFHNARDLLQELARRTTELQLSLARERHLREQNMRNMELELQDEERREQRLETVVRPQEYATSEAERVTRREAPNIPVAERASRAGAFRPGLGVVSRPGLLGRAGRFDPEGDLHKSALSLLVEEARLEELLVEEAPLVH